MSRFTCRLLVRCLCSLAALTAAGCQSPYHTDQGALVGGLVGAGTGAAIGSAVGKPGAGALIGTGVGALSGALIGSEMDSAEARNRAMIEQRMGRQVAAAPVTIDEVINMTRAGVNEELIISHVRSHGMAAPLQSSDLILLQQQGVSTRVIAAMQAPPVVAQPTAVPVVAQPAPVIVEQYVPAWGPAYYYRPHCHYRAHPGVTWGVSVSN